MLETKLTTRVTDAAASADLRAIKVEENMKKPSHNENRMRTVSSVMEEVFSHLFTAKCVPVSSSSLLMDNHVIQKLECDE